MSARPLPCKPISSGLDTLLYWELHLAARLYRQLSRKIYKISEPERCGNYGTIDMWTVRNGVVDWPIIEEIEHASDRAAVIVSASLIDDRLETALKTYFHYDERAKLDIFDGGPLASSSAKIKLGFLCCIYGENTRKNFEWINTIRNKFAHELSVNSFDHVLICDLVKKLNMVENIVNIPNVKMKAALIRHDFTAHELRPKYLNNVKILLFLLEMYRTFYQDRSRPVPDF